MFSRLLLNLGLVVLAIALVLVVVYRPGIEPEAVPQRIITTLAPDAVASITVTRDLRPPLTLTRKQDTWLVFTGDQEVPAAMFQVNTLLRLLITRAASSYPLASLDPAALGLDPPQATVTIDNIEIRFGGTEALENRRYIQLDDTVYLIDDQYQHLVNADWASFVSRKLISRDDAITRLELPGMSLSRDGDGHWQLQPEQADVSADSLQTLIDNWQRAQALYVRSYGGGVTRESVLIHTQNTSEPIELRVVSHVPDLVIARPDRGIQYHLTTGLEDSLFTLPKPPEEKPDEQKTPATEITE